ASCAYFLGPKAENYAVFRGLIEEILESLKNDRERIFPNDNSCFSGNPQDSEAFKVAKKRTELAVKGMVRFLGHRSVPFWSPRYQAHMVSDVSMPAVLGYFMTMLHNPNNVAVEASPVSSYAETQVGKQLCQMLGYNTDPEHELVGWGHLTSGGTTANMESIWVARNLKFYPVSLRCAMEPGSDLHFIADRFYVTPSKKGSMKKLFVDLTYWELFNLTPTTILNIPDRLYREFGISPSFLDRALRKFSVEHAGLEDLGRLRCFQPIQYLMTKTHHYSWPKGGALAGIGSKNFIGIPVKNDARMDIDKLRQHLERSLRDRCAVYAVVAIIGSTEDGAVDPLDEIIALRNEYQDRGLSFLVHADAAWGGYFASMLSSPQAQHQQAALCLRHSTIKALEALKDADSITVDPHKSGYIPYPAGSIVYRDHRLRNCIIWTSPYIANGSSSNTGFIGLEGSKPGAAAIATCMSHQCIGLTTGGYGALLSQVCFTSAKLAAHWSTAEGKYWKCVPLNAFTDNGKDEEVVKDNIRAHIVGRKNEDIVKDPRNIKILRRLGSDLNVNAFALNWKRSNGQFNTDVDEANYFMRRVLRKLSMHEAQEDPRKVPLHLTSTEFNHEVYGSCLDDFKSRLSLMVDKEPLVVLRNVVMSPFLENQNSFFHDDLFPEFVKVVDSEALHCQERQKKRDESPDYHEFLMQGSDITYLVYRPSFYFTQRRRQIILKVALGSQACANYFQADHLMPIFLRASGRLSLTCLKKGNQFEGSILQRSKGLEIELFARVEITIEQVLVDEPLSADHSDVNYPTLGTPFYLYGTRDQKHITHMLLRGPNVEISASNIHITGGDGEASRDWDDLTSGGLSIIAFTEEIEAAKFPLPRAHDFVADSFFFAPGKTFRAEV
ncbi:pyridoxal phosphate-dependent decarboxylase family protein, partial [Aspergillus vadensis CBS 113365]